MERGRYWLLTINNPVLTEVQILNILDIQEWMGNFQLEEGENGTEHWQLFIYTAETLRLSALKKVFTRAHTEKAKNAEKSHEYCQSKLVFIIAAHLLRFSSRR